MALKKALPNGNSAFKYHYRTGIWLSNIITGQDFGSQISTHPPLKKSYHTFHNQRRASALFPRIIDADPTRRHGEVMGVQGAASAALTH